MLQSASAAIWSAMRYGHSSPSSMICAGVGCWASSLVVNFSASSEAEATSVASTPAEAITSYTASRIAVLCSSVSLSLRK
jgi:hypothetical protein